MSMTQQQQLSLKHQLEARYAILVEEIRQELIRSDKQQYVDLAGQVHDLGDEAVADLLIDVELAVVDQQVKELHQIEVALQRLNMGSYGVCEACGEEIGVQRLQSQPSASRCIQCQREAEDATGRVIHRL